MPSSIIKRNNFPAAKRPPMKVVVAGGDRTPGALFKHVRSRGREVEEWGREVEECGREVEE
jgi:hypothetical protein